MNIRHTIPSLPIIEEVYRKVKEMLDSGWVTNSEYVMKLEEEVSKFLGVKHVIAVSSCTSGLMLVLKCLGIKGKIALSSYGFSSTAHACKWNGLKIALVDCKKHTYNIDPAKIPNDVDAILGTHIFGNPCDIKQLEEFGKPLLFDAAHAFGAWYNLKPVGGFGEAEVFSCSPTKPLCCIEGGLITTNNEELAETLRKARNYGYQAPDYDCKLEGLNARMGEFNAIVGLWNLANYKQNLLKREGIFKQYKEELEGIPFQKIRGNVLPSYCYCGIILEDKADTVYRQLYDNGVETKRYFNPPLHRMSLYKQNPEDFPNAEYISKNNLTLPVYPRLEPNQIRYITNKIKGVLQC